MIIPPALLDELLSHRAFTAYPTQREMTEALTLAYRAGAKTALDDVTRWLTTLALQADPPLSPQGAVDEVREAVDEDA